MQSGEHRGVAGGAISEKLGCRRRETAGLFEGLFELSRDPAKRRGEAAAPAARLSPLSGVGSREESDELRMPTGLPDEPERVWPLLLWPGGRCGLALPSSRFFCRMASSSSSSVRKTRGGRGDPVRLGEPVSTGLAAAGAGGGAEASIDDPLPSATRLLTPRR